MDFPLSLDDFLPLRENSITKNCKYKDKNLSVKVTHRINTFPVTVEEYIVYIHPDDEKIKPVLVGGNSDLYTVWTSALLILEQRLKT